MPQCLSHYASALTKLAIYTRDNWTCGYCLADMRNVHASALTLEHVTGTVGTGHRGANHTASGMFLACRSCNSSKGSVTRHNPGVNVDPAYFIIGYRADRADYKIRRIAALLSTPMQVATAQAEAIFAGKATMPNPTLLLKVSADGKVSREDFSWAKR